MGHFKRPFEFEKGSSITHITVDGKSVTDKPSVVRHFNDFFSTIGAKLASKFNSSHFSILSPRVVHDFCFVKVDGECVLKQLKNINPAKATGLDGIDTRLLKLSAEHICRSFTYLISLSLSIGVFPDDWKIARVVPLFKAGCRDDQNNYRPVSILPVVSKIPEGIVHDQLYRSLMVSKGLSEWQSGFRPGFSTAKAAHYLVGYN